MTTVTQVQLDNGLRVILKETHTAPVVSTWLWYRVGSRNETEGATGLSHWVEHMMFKGSSQFPKGSIMREVNRHGGFVNAMTSNDFTAYYTTLPSDWAELALRIEANRMTSALFDPDEVAAERTVIIAEREGSENDPRYVLAEQLMACAFGIHPYHHQTIGWKQDLLNITREQLYTHYRRYYVPNNAILVIVGDFNKDHLALVERYLSAIPAGPDPDQIVRQEPPQRGERRLKLRMPGSAPSIRVCHRTPSVSHPDYMPLVILDAVLSGGKAMFAFGSSPARSARLYRALVEKELANSVGSSYQPSLDPYVLTVGATVRDGRQPEELEQALLAELQRLCQEPVEERELAVAIRQTQAQFAYSSESVADQALTLGFLEIVDDHQRMPRILDELRAVTPDDVQRVAQTYLQEDNRAVGWFLPAAPGGASAHGGPAAHWQPPHNGRCFFSWKAAQTHFNSISPENVHRSQLANGATVLIKENPVSASVAVEGYLNAGSVHDTDETLGRAAFVAPMLRRGTARHTFQQLDVILDSVGASLSLTAGRDEMGFGGRALAEDVDLLIDLLSDMLLHPSFPQQEIDKLRGQLLTHLGILDMDTGYRADRAFMSALYPKDHPYARPVVGTRETLSTLTRESLIAFYSEHYHPSSLVISVVGAIDTGNILGALKTSLGQWQVVGMPPARHIPPAQTPAGIIQRRVHLPAKSQVDMILGVVAMPRRSPDYYAAMMANIILGHLGMMGRLGTNVRDEQGLAYYVSSGLRPGHGPYPWNVVAGVNPGKIDQAIEGILYELERLRDEPVSDQEFEDCKTFLTGALPLRLETNEGIAGFLLNAQEYELGLDYLQRYPSIIGAVTREEIQQVARKYLTPERYVLAMAGTFAE